MVVYFEKGLESRLHPCLFGEGVRGVSPQLLLPGGGAVACIMRWLPLQYLDSCIYCKLYFEWYLAVKVFSTKTVISVEKSCKCQSRVRRDGAVGHPSGECCAIRFDSTVFGSSIDGVKPCPLPIESSEGIYQYRCLETMWKAEAACLC